MTEWLHFFEKYNFRRLAKQCPILYLFAPLLPTVCAAGVCGVRGTTRFCSELSLAQGPRSECSRPGLNLDRSLVGIQLVVDPAECSGCAEYGFHCTLSTIADVDTA